MIIVHAGACTGLALFQSQYFSCRQLVRDNEWLTNCRKNTSGIKFTTILANRLNYPNEHVHTRLTFGVGLTTDWTLASVSSSVRRISCIDGLSFGLGCVHLCDISMHAFICFWQPISNGVCLIFDESFSNLITQLSSTWLAMGLIITQETLRTIQRCQNMV